MPLLVRNMAVGPTVFSDPSTNVAIEWERAGHPDGEDLQQVPDALSDNVSFLKCVQRGILQIEDGPEALKEAIAKQTAAYERKSQQSAQATADAIDPEADNDLVSVPCVGPNERGTGECGAPVPVREKSKNDHPPLCPKHSQFISQFVPEETDKLVDGKAQVKWVRVGKSAVPL
jgi:hypothetical protein